MLKYIGSLGAFLLLLLETAVPAVLINGTFDSGQGWTTAGDVQFGDGSVRLGDGSVTPSDSRLWQGVRLARGNYTISFSYLERLSMFAPQDRFHDVFFASLYFVNDLDEFDLDSGRFDGSLGLLDLQGNPLPAARDGMVLRMLLPAAQQVSFQFANRYRYVIPVFELIDLNAVANDSFVMLDDIDISLDSTPVIPEPATLGLMGIGLGLLALRRKRT